MLVHSKLIHFNFISNLALLSKLWVSILLAYQMPIYVSNLPTLRFLAKYFARNAQRRNCISPRVVLRFLYQCATLVIGRLSRHTRSINQLFQSSITGVKLSEEEVKQCQGCSENFNLVRKVTKELACCCLFIYL